MARKEANTDKPERIWKVEVSGDDLKLCIDVCQNILSRIIDLFEYFTTDRIIVA